MSKQQNFKLWMFSWLVFFTAIGLAIWVYCDNPPGRALIYTVIASWIWAYEIVCIVATVEAAKDKPVDEKESTPTA